MEKVTLGGDRLGAGNKQKVILHGFERTNVDLSYIWRSTMAAGTLVPFLCEIGLPGDTIDIKLRSHGNTNPTVGPLFGSYKCQYDLFQVPIRLYNSWLHNNKMKVGNEMKNVMLPQMVLGVDSLPNEELYGYEQINPSCILSYLGLRGIGQSQPNSSRSFNAVPLLAYWEIYKQYYANLQEEIGVVVHAINSLPNPITSIELGGITIPEYPTQNAKMILDTDTLIIVFNGDMNTKLLDFEVDGLGWLNVESIFQIQILSKDTLQAIPRYSYYGYDLLSYRWNGGDPEGKITLEQFELENIDKMREALLREDGNVAFNVMAQGLKPYTNLDAKLASQYCRIFSQEGLGVKTYQSDIFNNWLNEAWIGNIATQSAVSTISGSFTIDELTIKKKVWELLNRIAVSGGTYNDWLTATYDQKAYNRAESPVYIGGMSEELVFQEVISQSGTTGQPLGTIAGKGRFDNKRGGRVTVKCDEHCYIIGIVSLTPRIDYSQGNRYDTALQNMDEFHKPGLDQIGFQDLITEQMAWWTTKEDSQGNWNVQSAGKQPAWINYQTNYNRTFGNFAIPNNQMFMTLNRRYEWDDVTKDIKDLTTYIDPSKYNFVFAETALDSQNFWMQIGVDIEARRKMSAKIMPNL